LPQTVVPKRRPCSIFTEQTSLRNNIYSTKQLFLVDIHSKRDQNISLTK